MLLPASSPIRPYYVRRAAENCLFDYQTQDSLPLPEHEHSNSTVLKDVVAFLFFVLFFVAMLCDQATATANILFLMLFTIIPPACPLLQTRIQDFPFSM